MKKSTESEISSYKSKISNIDQSIVDTLKESKIAIPSYIDLKEISKESDSFYNDIQLNNQNSNSSSEINVSKNFRQNLGYLVSHQNKHEDSSNDSINQARYVKLNNSNDFDYYRFKSHKIAQYDKEMNDLFNDLDNFKFKEVKFDTDYNPKEEDQDKSLITQYSLDTDLNPSQVVDKYPNQTEMQYFRHQFYQRRDRSLSPVGLRNNHINVEKMFILLNFIAAGLLEFDGKLFESNPNLNLNNGIQNDLKGENSSNNPNSSKVTGGTGSNKQFNKFDLFKIGFGNSNKSNEDEVQSLENNQQNNINNGINGLINAGQGLFTKIRNDSLQANKNKIEENMSIQKMKSEMIKNKIDDNKNKNGKNTSKNKNDIEIVSQDSERPVVLDRSYVASMMMNRVNDIKKNLVSSIKTYNKVKDSDKNYGKLK